MFTELFTPCPPKITLKVVEEAGQKIQQVELLKGVARDSITVLNRSIHHTM